MKRKRPALDRDLKRALWYEAMEAGGLMTTPLDKPANENRQVAQGWDLVMIRRELRLIRRVVFFQLGVIIGLVIVVVSLR